MNAVKRVSPQTFHQEISQSTMPVLIDFYADWCGPCRLLAPMLERLASEFAGRVKIAKVNIDDEPMLADRFQVESIPTLLFMQNGQVIGRTSGLPSEAALRQTLEKVASAKARRVG